MDSYIGSYDENSQQVDTATNTEEDVLYGRTQTKKKHYRRLHVKNNNTKTKQTNNQTQHNTDLVGYMQRK